MAFELVLFMCVLKCLNGKFRTWHMLQGSSLYVGPPAIRLIEWMTTSMAPNVMFRNPCSVGGALFSGWILLSWLMNFAMVLVPGMSDDTDLFDDVVLPIFVAGNVIFVVFLCIFICLVKKEYFKTFTSRERPYQYMYQNFWHGGGSQAEVARSRSGSISGTPTDSPPRKARYSKLSPVEEKAAAITLKRKVSR